MITAIDVGYGFTKTCYSAGDSIDINQTDMFVTAVSKFIPESSFGEKPVVITVNGESFAVGDSATREGKTVSRVHTAQNESVTILSFNWQ